MTSWNNWEIELFCMKCDHEFVVTGKRLSQSSEVPCPACGEIVGVAVWDWHSQWAWFAKRLGWK